MDHGLNATRAAFAIKRTSSSTTSTAGSSIVQLHMGINSGEALVGATKIAGASQRWTFTATKTTTIRRGASPAGADGEIIVGPTTTSASAPVRPGEPGERAFKNVSSPSTSTASPPGVYEKIV